MNKKIVGTVLAVSVSLLLTEGYFLFLRPQQNLDSATDTSDSTSPKATSPSLIESTTELPNTTTGQAGPDVSFVPAIPEFTITLTNHSLDTPTTYSTDPYTGQTITTPGTHSEWQTLDLTIKNQPFTPVNGNGFQYNIRYKGHFTQDWITLLGKTFGAAQNSTSEYTTLSFVLYGRGNGSASSGTGLSFPANSQVDFQVDALIGSVTRVPPFWDWTFAGEESGWSPTQTILIP